MQVSMDWWLPPAFEKKKPFLETRAVLIKALRAFFDGERFLEVETPALQACPAQDMHIHGFKTELFGPDLRPERDFYLHTSPEFAMKKLLVAGLPKIYQICHVFRNGEHSRLHSPEFSMLEWYRISATYRDIFNDCINLTRHCAEQLKIKEFRHGSKTADPFLKWNIISVQEAFDQYAKIDLLKYLDDTGSFSAVLKGLEIRTAPDDAWDDLFFRIMAEKIEPHLGLGAPCILYDYPVCMASLARRKSEDPRFAERFEVYVCGVELANGFSELTDAAEQRARFREEMDRKEALYGIRYPADEDFMRALEHGMPESAGIALGVDRLAMLAAGAEDIRQVLWAPVP